MKLKRRKSIFIKLLAAYGTAFILISAGAVTVRYLSLSMVNLEMSLENVERYAGGLATEIGAPPDLDAADRIAGETGLKIEITGNGLVWSSEEEPDEEEDESFIELNESFEYLFPGSHDRPVSVTRDGYEYSFRDFHHDLSFSLLSWIIMAASISVGMLASYLMVRRLLKPIRIMNRVALEFGVSHWKQRVNPGGNDELATLGRAMDTMAERIENHIRSMQDLLIGVSHELRSPLTRMKVALEFIENQRIRSSLNEEIETLDHLTGNLLEQNRLTSQPDALNRAATALHAWLEEIIRPFRTTGMRIETEFLGTGKTVHIDRSRMEMAVRNLLENARRHAPASPVKILLDTRTEEEFFSLTVSDEGPGLPDHLLSRAGEPFLLGDPSRSGGRSGGGFGLGLSIVKATVEAHGGSITVENKEPSGLRLVMRLPCRTDPN